jgi:hypothetical protein
MTSPGLARQITTAFVNGTVHSRDRAAPKGNGWEALPELMAANRLRAEGASVVDVRLFCTFTAAMDRARGAEVLWRKAADLFLRQRWVFEPEAITRKSYGELKDVLQKSGVSQRHHPDTCAWLAIANSLSQKNRAPLVYDAIYEGTGNAKLLLRAISTTDAEGALFPLLKGPKIRLMWVRMLVNPGSAHIQDLGIVPVAVDVQVRKVTEYLGLSDTLGQPLNDQVRKKIQVAWQRDIDGGGAVGPPDGPSILTDTAAALDPALWFVGNWGCTFCERHNRQKFPIADFCRSCNLSAATN